MYVCIVIKLKQQTVDFIKDEKPLFIKIQAALGVSEKTMYDYINKNSHNLTKLDSISTIVEHTGKPLSELVDGIKINRLLSK